MKPANGYRLKASSVAEVSQLLDGFRTDAVRVLARGYGRLVAHSAVSAHDRACAGLADHPRDPFAAACRAVREANPADPSGLVAPDLNCVVAIHFVRDAVLARFVHGGPQYLKAWEAMRGVVPWGWSEGPRPAAVAERSWEIRAKYWQAASPKSGLGALRFTLVEGQLPSIGWAGVHRYVPGYEQRLSTAAAAIDKALSCGLAQARERAAAVIPREITKDSLLRPARPASARPRPAAPATGAQRIRSEAEAARKERREKAKRVEVRDTKAVEIDHADVVVSSDGRTFVAVPYVGLDPETRVFLQVGDGHLAVSQGGVQFGHVSDVPRSAIDALRLCRTVVMVEVDGKGNGRLLRAKHVAIVSDIGLAEGLKVPLGAFKRNKGGRGAEEMAKWESGQ